MRGCRCDDHTHHLSMVEGRWFLRCGGCGALSVSIPLTSPRAVADRRGAEVVNPVRFRDACEGLTPAALRGLQGRRENERSALIMVVLLIATFLVAWVKGGAP